MWKEIHHFLPKAACNSSLPSIIGDIPPRRTGVRWNTTSRTCPGESGRHLDAEFTGHPSDLYGEELSRTLNRPPDSAFVAEGSAVSVYSGSAIR
jgi:hypothetical protein